jgi:hypothetical protein
VTDLYGREECIFSNGEVGMFSFVGLCIPFIPCNSQDGCHHRSVAVCLSLLISVLIS